MTKWPHFNILIEPMASRINFIDIYSFYDELDASVIETLLEDYDISCSIRTFNPFADADAYFEKRIAVEEDKVENARRIINDARKNGVISRDGRFRV